MYGTLTTLDDLRDNTQSVATFGEDLLAERFATALRVHNDAMQEAIADFAIVTDQAQLPYGGGADDMEMQELDQMGSPDVQKETAAGNVGLPLRWYGIAIQWNRHFVVNTSVATAVDRLDGAAAADVRNVTRQIRRALMNPVNNLAYVDKLQTRLTLPIRALLNGDGRAIPVGPNGEAFAGSHTHYRGAASFTEAHLVALLETVLEHGVTGGMAIYINRAQEAALRGFAGFTPYVDARINVPLTDQTARGEFDVNNPADRAIGIFEGAEVSVKPWVPANYQVVFDRGVGTDKAVGIRTRSGAMAGDAYQGGFGLLYEDENFPLRARAMGREFGVGAIRGHKAAVGFSGNATYTAPAL